MKKQDLEQIRLIVREEIRIQNEPIIKLTYSHQQTLHGVNGDNGLVSEVRDIKKKVFMIVSGVTTLLSTIFNGILYLLNKKGF
jgi:hypothetical protein